jgi:serine/threonine protein kinase
MIFESVYNYKIDIWALGILLYELLHGFAPFKGNTVNEVKHKMKIGDYTLNTHISEECKELIIAILKFDPEERATIEQI